MKTTSIDQNSNNGAGNITNGRVVVINPNSTKAVTKGIDAALDPLRFSDGPQLDCITIEEGPQGIATQRHVDDAAGSDATARPSRRPPLPRERHSPRPRRAPLPPKREAGGGRREAGGGRR